MKVNDYIITPDNMIFKIDYIVNGFVSNGRCTKSWKDIECRKLSEEQMEVLGWK